MSYELEEEVAQGGGDVGDEGVPLGEGLAGDDDLVGMEGKAGKPFDDGEGLGDGGTFGHGFEGGVAFGWLLGKGEVGGEGDGRFVVVEFAGNFNIFRHGADYNTVRLIFLTLPLAGVWRPNGAPLLRFGLHQGR